MAPKWVGNVKRPSSSSFRKSINISHREMERRIQENKKETKEQKPEKNK